MKLEQALVEYGLKPAPPPSLVDQLMNASETIITSVRTPQSVGDVLATTPGTWAGGTLTATGTGNWIIGTADTTAGTAWNNDPQSGFFRVPTPPAPPQRTPYEQVAADRAERRRRQRTRNQNRRSR